MEVACIGSRGLSPEYLHDCEILGACLVNAGHRLRTGNAPGTDQAFARGANGVSPESVYLCLPWRGFEKEAIHPQNHVVVLEDCPADLRSIYQSVAAQFHPVYPRLPQGAKKLMMRNSLIMFPPHRREGAICQPVDLCLAWPSEKRGGGGTGQGMRIARYYGVTLVDLRQASVHDVTQMLTRKGEEERR